MDAQERSGSLNEIHTLARELAWEAVRKIALRAFASALLFSAAAAVTCRLAFESPGGSSLVRTLGKTGVFALFLLGGILAGSLHGAASALLGRIDRIRKSVTTFLDTELFAKIPEGRVAEGMHELRLTLKARLGSSAGLRLLRALPAAGAVIRSIETLGTETGEIRDARTYLSETVVGTVIDDLRRQGNRTRNVAYAIGAVLTLVPVLLFFFRG